MATRLSDCPVEELPCVRADMSLLLIMAGQFCPGYSSSIFSPATPYSSISISSLVKGLSANILQTFSQTREKQRRRAAGLSVQSCFRFPQGVWMQIERETYARRPCCGYDPCSWTTYPHVGKILHKWENFLSWVSSILRHYYQHQNMLRSVEGQRYVESK